MRLYSILLLCTVLVVSASTAYGQSGVGFFKKVSGEVLLIRGDAEQQVEAGQQIELADTVVTRSGSHAAIIFQDGTRLTLDQGSELQVRQYTFIPHRQDYGFLLFLKNGSMIYSSGKLGKLAPEKVNLKTPRTTVGIRGTRLLLSVK